jgi:hypothetical protein
MTGLAWFEGLDDASLDVAVDDEVVHRVSWRHGKLILEDHDVEAEQALVALGGERCQCLDIADLFASPPPLHELLRPNRGRGSFSSSRATRGPVGPPLPPGPIAVPPGTAVAVSSTGFPPSGPAFQRMVRHLPAAVVSRMQHEQEEQRKRFHRLRVLGWVDGDLRRRLLAASSVAATRRGVEGYPDDWISVNKFYAGELAPAIEWSLRGARRNLPVTAKIDFHLRLLEDTDQPTVEGLVSRGGGSVNVGVQPRWLADVWAHDLTLVGQHPVLAVEERQSFDSAVVVVIGWLRARFELTEPFLARLLIERDELGFWHSVLDQRSR